MSEIPSMYDLFRPCLELLDKGTTNARGCLPALQKLYSLSDEQMGETIPSGQRTRIFDRADWAIFHLMKADLVERPKRGFYQPSAEGRELARSDAPVSWDHVKSRPAYLRWKAATQKDETVAQASVAKPVESALPPAETIEAAFQEISQELAEDLLDQVLTLTPARFERLIVELLLAMGYGDGRAEMGQAIGKSGDGGIDGVVNEDKLGLDAVYIQAKRYAPENTVGRPALQAFIGSMTGESATKGVFVTTSSFSKEARDFVQRVQQRVVLIDGARLARLMIDHGVGVRVDKTYVLRSIDANFFDVN